MRIDPSRLSRLLTALSQKTSGVDLGKIREAPANPQTALSRTERDIKVLRNSLRNSLRTRLRTLAEDDAQYDNLASIITIQEILVWEFGQDIVNHAEFQRIVSSVTATMMQDSRTAASLRRIVQELVA